MTVTVKRRKFKTEVQQLLDLVIHSLYTHPDIFLRELISNASDAIDRARFEALSDESILEDDPEWKIRLIPDRENRILTVADNGIGMTAEEVEANIGTIASSGTRRFLAELKERQGQLSSELIGQFGVGFYSAFMVADKVAMVTRRAGNPEDAVKWESTGAGSYSLAQAHKEKRGTEVTLHLKEGMDEFLEEWRLRKIVKTYSDFVEHPIVMKVERPRPDADAKDGKEPEKEIKDEVLNSQKAIWLRPKSEISDEQYKEFYQHISHDFGNPLTWLHWNAEGTTEFNALLYLPERAPFDLFMPENRHRGIHLYVKRVFITDNCEALVPSYLRFLRGVVDSSDLPLNVSRETLQEEKVIRVIQKNLVRKVLDTLKQMISEEKDKYLQFWHEFGRVLKEGVHTDLANREKLQELLLFESTREEPGKMISLAEYADSMQEGQKAIYYLTGESRGNLEKSPLLEAFAVRDYNVLLMTDPIDEWVVQAINSYSDKPLKSIAKGDLELDLDEQPEKKDDGKEPEAEKKEAIPPESKELIAVMQDVLKEKVKEVRVSKRLTDSPCCLVSDDMDIGVHMEKILKAMHQEMPATKRILEINPAHPLLKAMNNMAKDSSRRMKFTEYAELLYDQALLTAGLEIPDPMNFARRVSHVMADAVKS